MTGPGLDIDTALSGDGTIPTEQVLSWIDAAADSDLPTLSKLYRLTGEGYYRIQPEFGKGLRAPSSSGTFLVAFETG